jgi:hypothetical protein
MPWIELTPNNAHQNINNLIRWKNIYGEWNFKDLLSVAVSGKSVKIDMLERGNRLEIVSRNVEVFID